MANNTTTAFGITLSSWTYKNILFLKVSVYTREGKGRGEREGRGKKRKGEGREEEKGKGEGRGEGRRLLGGKGAEITFITLTVSVSGALRHHPNIT